MEGATAAASFVADADNLKATELRLGLPGTEEEVEELQKSTTTTAALLPTPPSTPRGKKRDGSGPEEAAKTAPPAAKAQVVGWPPLRSYRKTCFHQQQQQQQQASSKTQPTSAPEESATAATATAATAGPGAGASNALFVKVHGRRSVPAEGGPEDVQRLPGAEGGAGGHVPPLLRQRQRRGRRAGRQPLGVRRHLRGQGRRPHARRRRALRHVHQHLQEAEDHEGI